MKLCIRLGDERTAIGAVILAWRIAQKYWCPEKQPVPQEAWVQSGIGREIIDVGLAKETEAGIYISGAEEHFAWYFGRLEAAKKGGQARASRAQRDTSGRLVPAGARQNQPPSSVRLDLAGFSTRQNQPSSSSSSSSSISVIKKDPSMSRSSTSDDDGVIEGKRASPAVVVALSALSAHGRDFYREKLGKHFEDELVKAYCYWEAKPPNARGTFPVVFSRWVEKWQRGEIPDNPTINWDQVFDKGGSS